jgi:hypothetical protein
MVSAPQLYPDGNTSFSLYEDDGVTRQVSANVGAIEAPLVLPVVTRVYQRFRRNPTASQSPLSSQWLVT